MTEEEARREAARCLDCGICSECHLCVRVCKAGAIDHQEAPFEEEIAGRLGDIGAGLFLYIRVVAGAWVMDGMRMW